MIFLLSNFLKNNKNPMGTKIMKEGIIDHPKNLVMPTIPYEKNSRRDLWSATDELDDVSTIYLGPLIIDVNPSEPVVS